MIGRSFIISALFCFVPISAYARRITFKEAIQIAIEKSPTLSSVRSEIKITELEYSNSYSPFLPQLNLDATQGVRGSDPSVYTNNNVNIILDICKILA